MKQFVIYHTITFSQLVAGDYTEKEALDVAIQRVKDDIHLPEGYSMCQEFESEVDDVVEFE